MNSPMSPNPATSSAPTPIANASSPAIPLIARINVDAIKLCNRCTGCESDPNNNPRTRLRAGEIVYQMVRMLEKLGFRVVHGQKLLWTHLLISTSLALLPIVIKDGRMRMNTWKL